MISIRKIFQLLCFLGLVLVLIIGNVYAISNEEEHYNRGVDYYKKGMYDEAMIEFDKVIQINPNIAYFYVIRGLCIFNKGNVDQAIGEYDRAIQINPNLFDAYKSRGEAYEAKKDFDQAISDYTKAIQIDPSSVLLYIRRGTCFIQKRDYAQAISDVSKVIQISPDNPNMYGLRAELYCLNGDYENGLKDMNKAIALGDNIDPTIIDMIQKGVDRKRKIANINSEIKEYENRSAQIQLEQKQLEIVGKYFSDISAQQQQQREMIRYQAEQQAIYNRAQDSSQRKRYNVRYNLDGSGATIEEQ